MRFIALVLAMALLVTGAAPSDAPLPCRAPTLGTEVTNVSYNMRRIRGIPGYVAGAMVRVVRMRSAAARAGILAGDVIQAVGGNLIQNVCDFHAALQKHGCEDVELTIRRGTDTIDITAHLTEMVPRPPGKLDEAGACRNGDGAACTELARAHDMAVDLLQLACDLGDGDGCYELGLKVGYDKRAVAAYEQACDAGSSLGCTNLGYMFQYGKGVAVDLDGAVRLYKRGCDGSACSEPNNVGCVNVGRMYRDGTGVPKDQTRATTIFRQVCDRHPAVADVEDAETIARACSLAGTSFLMELGVSRDMPQALTLLEKGCAGGDTFGCFNLGTVYENGKFVKADKVRAATYYKRACDQHDDEACKAAEALTR